MTNANKKLMAEFERSAKEERMRDLHADLSNDLDEIKRRFVGSPKVTLIVRFDNAPEKGVFLSDDDFELAVRQVRSLETKSSTVRIDPIPEARRAIEVSLRSRSPATAPDSPVIPESSMLFEVCRNAMQLLRETGFQRVNPNHPIWQRWEKFKDAPAVADTREPTPEEMLRGASEFEAIAEGLRDVVAGRVTPFDPDAETGTTDGKLPRSFVDAAAQQLDTREREWRQWQVQFKDAKNRTYHEWKCDEDMADLYVEFLHNQTVLGPMHDIRKQHSDDGGKSWVDADTPSDKERA